MSGLCVWHNPLLFTLGGGLLINRDYRVNEEIKVREVRLVGEDGEQLGIVSLKEALDLAEERNLDLVEVAPGAKPPVCRIMDFGKFCYEQSKREKEARKKQRIITVKEVKMRPNIERHDMETKEANARRFLEDGDKVKVTIMFRGREVSHSELGLALCRRFAEDLSALATVEKEPKLEGRNMTMFLAPRSDIATSKEEKVDAKNEDA